MRPRLPYRTARALACAQVAAAALVAFGALAALAPEAHAQETTPPTAEVPADTFARLPLRTAADAAAYAALFRALDDREVGPDSTSLLAALDLAAAVGHPADHGLLLRRVLLDAYFGRNGYATDEAIDSLHAALVALAPRMDPAERGGAYNFLGNIAANRGASVAEVLTYYRSAAESSLDFDPVNYHYAVGNLAHTYFDIGDTATADVMLRRSLKLAREIYAGGAGTHLAYSNTFDYAWLSGIALGRRQYDSAAHFLSLAEANRERLRGSTRYAQTRATVYGQRACLHTALGRYPEAAADIDTLRAHDAWNAPLLEAEWLAAQGRYPEAIATLRQNPPEPSTPDALQYREALWRYSAAADQPAAALAAAAEVVDRYRADLLATHLDLAASTDAQRRSFEAERRAIAERHAQEVAAYEERLRTYGSLAAGAVFLLAAAYFWRRQRRARRRSADLSQIVVERDRDLEVANGKLATANAQLARRIKAMERFNHLLSHDLREPVRSISGFTTLLRRRVRHDASLTEDVGFLARAVDQLGHLLARLEILRRVEEQSIGADAVTVRHRCEVSIRTLRERAPRAAVKLVIDAETAACTVPDTLTGIALDELLGNAALFGPVGPPDSAGAPDGAGAPPPISLSVVYDADAGTCAFTVADHGIGIAPDYHERVFEAFRRLNRREDYPGAGIGLTLARSAALRAGGEVTLVRSAPGEGAVFRLTVAARAGDGTDARALPHLTPA